MRLFFFPCLLVLYLFCTSISIADIVIDGHLDEPEWQNSYIVSDFITLKPLSLEKPKYRTETKIFTSEQGIYFGFINYQPTSVERERSSFSRDSELLTDRNVIIIDFNGNHHEAYEFTVSLSNSVRDGIVTNEKEFRYDWDGIWHHQTHEQENYWFSEIMIPWSSVPMSVKDKNRKINIYLAREVNNEQLRFAFPNATWGRATFISDLSPLKINSYSVQSIDFFPYVTSLTNQISEDTEFDVGAELFWKPSSNKQISLAINPDFGQVESDNLVVNFSSLETFFSEKRPFFTENQSLFLKEYSNGGYLVHTRRIGGAPDHADDTTGISDIDFALKYSHLDDPINFGAFIVAEDDTDLSQGRNYGMTRIHNKRDDLSLGYFLTYVDRPTIERMALTQEVDFEYEVSPETRMTLSLTSNDIEDSNTDDSLDYIVDFTWNKVIDDVWSHYINAMYIGDKIDLSDMGYMPRNDLIKLGGQHQHTTRYNNNSLLRDTSYKILYDYQSNNENDRLESNLMLISTFNFKDTSRFYLEIKRTFDWLDDRTMQNGGIFNREKRWGTYWLYDGQQTGKIKHRFKGWLFQQDFDGLFSQLYYQPTWNINDNLSINGHLAYSQNSEWLIWRNYDGTNALYSELVSFSQEQLNSSFSLNWHISEFQDLRFKFEWIGLKALANSGYEPGANGFLQGTAQQHTDFELSNTALQLRYRYELAKLSNIYVVWSRGANYYTDVNESSFDSLLNLGWSNKTTDQFLIKVRYHF